MAGEALLAIMFRKGVLQWKSNSGSALCRLRNDMYCTRCIEKI